MNSEYWWDKDNDKGFINSILKFSVEARKWYLKIDVKVRLKRFITRNLVFDEIIQLWKRLQIVKKDFGEEIGSLLIRQAIKEIQKEFDETKWEQVVREKIRKARKGLNDKSVKSI